MVFLSLVQTPIRELVHRLRVGVLRVMSHAEGEVTQSEPVLVAGQRQHHPELAIGRWQVDLETTRQLGPVSSLRVAAPQAGDSHPAGLISVPGLSKYRHPGTTTAHDVLRKGDLVNDDPGMARFDAHRLPLAVGWEERPMLTLEGGDLLVGGLPAAGSLEDRLPGGVGSDHELAPRPLLGDHEGALDVATQTHMRNLTHAHRVAATSNGVVIERHLSSKAFAAPVSPASARKISFFRTVCAAIIAVAAAACLPAAAQASFGFLPAAEGFSAAATKADGSPVTAAGTHPYAFKLHLGFDTEGGAQDLRDLTLHLPPGLLVNPMAIPECPSVFGACPNSSQVGVVSVGAGGTTTQAKVFSLAPSFGTAAAFGFLLSGTPVVLAAHLREGDAGLDLALEGLSKSLGLEETELTIWGTPWEEAHNPERGFVFGSVPAPVSQIKSYLTLPTTPCGSALPYTAAATSWQGQSAAAGAGTPALSACNKALSILAVQLMTDVGAARTGLAFNLDVPSGGGILNPGGIARPAIKTAVVSLPEGLTINPSLGAGLGVCSEADFARESAGSEPGAGCPNNSKIGSVTLDGALGLAEPMAGSVYLAKPYENPAGTLLAVYVLARSPGRGLIVKSQGKIVPDPTTGRLLATFDNLPRFLYTHFDLTLREGQRSTLVSPSACGAYPTDLQIASWAEPQAFKHEASTFFINHGEGGGACPGGGVPPFHPGLLAGSINPTARAFTPFYLRMTRTDGEQEITSYSASFPPGLLARIAGVGECSDAAIAAAKARTGPHGGAEEQAAPSCPASALIGHTLAGYGVGSVLAYAPGNLYLAGPYHGAPLSVVAVDSALIGPFDLGVVVVRSAIRIDPRTAQASIDSAGSDPIPHILAGIPLHLRDIRVSVDRPDFTLNPTSCDHGQVLSTLTGAGADPFSPADDSTATSTQRYQLLNCSVLDFKPKLSLRLGALRHGAFPSLRATYAPRAGDANLGAVSVTLPPAVFLAQNHIRTVCTRVQFAARACPAASVYGHARAITPLLSEPLEGPVYLRSSRVAVPDLVADLRGRGIEIEVPARIDSSRAGIRANFEGLPDAPVTKFTMVLDGGKRGLLQNGEDLCRAKPRANARFVAQNNETAVGHPKLTVKCTGKKGGRK